MKNQKNIKIAIIGAGQIASLVHIPVWKKISTSEVVGIFDINKKTSRKIADQYKIPKVYPNLNELVEDTSIDLVDICTPIHTHVSIIKTALNANKNVITEKPLALRSEEAEHIVHLSEQKKLVLGVSQNHLYSKSVRTLKNKLNEGYIGDPLLYNVTYPISIYKTDHWTSNPKTGGLLFELGIHPAYIAAFLFGKPEKVYAFGNEPSPDLRPGWISVILEKDRKIFNINLTAVEEQPTIRVMASKGYAIVNLFADALYFNNIKTMHEWGKTSMRSMTSAGLAAAKNWLEISGRVAISYMNRGLKYWILKHRALNQFTFFKEILSEINTSDTSIKKRNKEYLEVAIESIRILEQVKKACN